LTGPTHVWRIVLARCRALLRRDAIADEIEEEMQFHLEMRVEALQRRGLQPDEARRQALQRFGNVALQRDRGYDVRGGGVMETVLQDLRYSVRLLRAQPAFSTVAIATLAVGIGLSTTLFTVIHAALIRPLPFPAPEQLVSAAVTRELTGGRTSTTGPSLDDARAWRTDGRIFSHVAVDRGVRELIVEIGEPARVGVGRVSEDYFELFGVRPAAGRLIRFDDTRLGAPLIALAGHRYWQTRFGGDVNAIGRVVRIDGEPATIVGILPPGFHPDVALWQPIRFDAAFAAMRGTGADVIGRLRPGLEIEAAALELTRLTNAISQTTGGPIARVRLQSMYAEVIGGRGTIITTLAVAVGAVLLIACVNVAGLLLARGTIRARELAVRASIGAGRARLARQLLTESVVLAALGGAAGIALAWLSLDVLVAMVPMSIPTTAHVALNLEVLAASGLTAVAAAIVFGLLPAARLSRVDVLGSLARGGRRTGAALSRRSGQSLVAIEVALAVVLLAGAGLMIRSFTQLLAVDLGFDPASFLTMEVAPADPSPQIAALYYPALVDRLRQMPDVIAAGASNQLPLGGSRRAGFVRWPGSAQSIRVDQRWILPGYFEAIGLRPAQGRLPTDADLRTARPVMLINEMAARQIFPDGRSVVGRTFPIEDQTPEVIGVVGDMLQNGAQAPARANVYWLYDGKEDLAGIDLAIFVRPRPGAANLVARLREAALAVGPPVVIDRIGSGETFLSENVTIPRRRMQLLGVLGGVGLLLTLVGVASVTAYAVASRTREIGVRVALGARAASVVRTFVLDAAWPVAIGLIAGLLGAYFATRIIASLLFETSPHDPIAYTVAAGTLAAAAVLAAWLPARRAATVDPVTALRAE
jgi:predicted permease